MRLIKIISLALLVSSFSSNAKMKESDYVNKYCEGRIEVVLPSRKRVDCLTAEYAIEYDYRRKWAEAFGQSIHYSIQTGKKPGIVLIGDYPKIQKELTILHNMFKHVGYGPDDYKIFVIALED